MKENKIRINKAMAGAGVCSRRGADDLIRGGAVKVNGQTINEPGLQLGAGDKLEVNGQLVNFAMLLPPEQAGQEDSASSGKPGNSGRHLPWREGGRLYLMLHKPTQVVCTARDPQGRQTVLDLVPEQYRARRLYPVGRLDYFSEGLLLLTDDGDLTQRLTHPRHHLPKYYEVLLRAEGGVPEAALDEMRQGMLLAEGEKLAPVEVARVEAPQAGPHSFRPVRGQTLLRLTLRQGVNRQIRRMCRDFGLTILRLCRVAQGDLQLGDLPEGGCRRLGPDEVARLKKAVGLG